MLKTFRESLCAGILITIGGCVFLACSDKVVGAVLFSVALLCICFKGYYLFTGKVGYLAEDHGGKNCMMLAVGLLGNLVITFALGRLIREVMPALGETAAKICGAKLEQTLFQTLVRGMFCGMLMYLAVSIYKEKKTALAILFCVPVFILSGFEHSIADSFYFGASGLGMDDILPFQAMTVLGNSLGGVALPLLKGKE